MKEHNPFLDIFKKAENELDAKYIYFANYEYLKPYEVPDFDAAYTERLKEIRIENDRKYPNGYLT